MPQELEHVGLKSAESKATLGRVSAEVLETMFFTEAVAAECEHSWLTGAVSVQVGFDGSHFGEMRIAVACDAVSALACGFLGLDPEETDQAQRSQVILELANILCGAVLSSLWPESRLLLDPPQLTEWTGDAAGAWHSCLALPEGMVAISIRLAGVRESS